MKLKPKKQPPKKIWIAFDPSPFGRSGYYVGTSKADAQGYVAPKSGWVVLGPYVLQEHPDLGRARRKV